MLSRAAYGGFRGHNSTTLTRLAINSPSIRTYAKNSARGKPPLESKSRSPSVKKTPAVSQQTGGVGTRSGAASTANSAGRPNPLSGHDGIRRSGPSSEGAVPFAARVGSSHPEREVDFSKEQDVLSTVRPRDGITAPQFSSPSTIDPAIAHASSDPPSRPLPDLTKGIPSTIDAEMDLGSTTLNLTEDPSRPTAGSGGRGDFPKESYISSHEQRRNRMANLMYAAMLLLAVTGPVYLGRNWETKEEERKHPDAPSGWGIGLFYHRAAARLASSLDYYNEPVFEKLLPDVDPVFERPFTLVLSLEDLLVHSEWSREHGWRMAKRPGVDYFLRYLQQYYELVIFTSVPSHIAEPVLAKLDPFQIVTWPLFREASRYKNGEYIKDLSFLNRDLSKVILIDTVSAHAKNQPENAVILPKWKGDKSDTGLVSLIPFLEYVATMGFSDTRSVLKSFEGKHIPTEFAAREKIARQKFQQQLAEERGSRSKRVGKGFMNRVLGIQPGMGLEGGEQSPAEAFEQGKMLQDQIRERGQKQYEALEKEIRENGDKWLQEMAAQTKKMTDEQMKGMKNSIAGVFVGGTSAGGDNART